MDTPVIFARPLDKHSTEVRFTFLAFPIYSIILGLHRSERDKLILICLTFKNYFLPLV